MEVKEHPVLRSLFEKFGLGGAEPRQEASATSKKSQPKKSQPTDGETVRRLNDFKSGLNKILWQRQTDISDHVYLIGLEKIRERLGAKWDRSKEKIHETVRAIVEQRMSPRDLYTQYDDERYLIVFSASGKKEAQLKCSLISQEIIKRLVGPETVSDYMAVKTVAIQENGQLRLKELPSVQSLLENVIEEFDRGSTTVSSPDAKVESSEAKLASSEGTSISTPRRPAAASLEGVRFIFHPLLAVRTKVISTFLAIPVRPLGHGRYLSSYQVLGDSGDPDQIYSLDMFTLQKVAAEVSSLVEIGGRSLLALPVHYETIADSEKRRAYSGHCATHFSDRGNRVVFEMIGLPAGVPQSRLVELVSALRPLGRAVIARFQPNHRNFTAYRTAGLHAVGVDIYEAEKSESRLMKEIDDFVQSAKKNQLKTYIEGVRSISLFTAAITSGFDYIAGYALSSVAEAAEDIHAFRLETPYLSLLDTAPSVQE